jgi:branched-chain amino acid aminotransferase
LIKAGIEHNLSSNAQTAQLDASKLKISLTSAPRDPPAAGSEELKKMRTCTDHMLTARWTLEDGWEAPEIKPYGPLSIMPTASVLHYATECFEGYVCEGTDTTSQKLRRR